MECIWRPSRMAIAPDIPGRCRWKKTFDCGYNKKDSESSADSRRRRCSRQVGLFDGLGNRKWRQFRHRHDYADVSRETVDRGSRTNTRWLMDAAHHGGAFSER